MKKLIFLILTGAAFAWVTAVHAQSSNTLVRFRFESRAIHLGDVDVELFDTIKPNTVRNFLNYVTNGSLDNTILHRLHFSPQITTVTTNVAGNITNRVTNVVVSALHVLQGGSARVVNPRSPALFNDYLPTISLGPISNEFHLAPTQYNTFGTLAMAKVAGNPDSATFSWFFNLTNSSFLDTNNGGFTVFGRVVAGGSLLGEFKRLAPANGIVNLTQFYPGASLFAELPVAYFGNFPPLNIDLFTVRVILLGSADRTRPSVTITSPAADARFTNQTITVAGTARDGGGVHKVWYSSSAIAETSATNTTNWTATVPLRAGTNYFFVDSVDTSGNRSVLAARNFFHVVPSTFHRQVHGSGQVSGPADGQALEVGGGYTLTATPAPNHLFLRWTGDVFSASARLDFIMRTNMMIAATFVTNPFIALKGTYNGLFYETGVVRHARAGFITATLTDSGRFTAKLLTEGRTIPFKGQFDPEAKAAVPISHLGTELIVRLGFDTQTGSMQMTGSVSGANWRADGLSADRVPSYTGTNQAPHAGKYTLILANDTNVVIGPRGDSIGTVSVTAKGALTVNGMLADGSRMTQRTSVSQNGRWPFYAPLNSGRSVALGFLSFTNRPEDDVNGEVVWVKSSTSLFVYYREGFTVTNRASGSRYQPPVGRGGQIVGFTNGIVVFNGGDIARPLTNVISIGAANRITSVTTSNELAMTLAPATGLFKGSIKPPGFSRATFHGVIHQKGANGAGFFYGPTKVGHVFFGPRPD